MAAPAELNRKCTRAEAVDCALDHVVDRRALGDVDVQRQRLAALAVDLLGGLRAPSSLMSAQTTLAPSRAKISAVARPMPLAGAGDDDGFAGEIVRRLRHRPCPPCISCRRQRIMDSRRRRPAMTISANAEELPMPTPIEYADASPAVRAVYDDIKKTRNVAGREQFLEISGARSGDARSAPGRASRRSWRRARSTR